MIVKALPTWREEQEPTLLYLYLYPFTVDYFCLL